MGVQDIILCTGERAHDSSEALCSYYQRINMVFNELAKNKDLIFQDESMRNADFKLPVICTYKNKCFYFYADGGAYRKYGKQVFIFVE